MGQENRSESFKVGWLKKSTHAMLSLKNKQQKVQSKTDKKPILHFLFNTHY